MSKKDKPTKPKVIYLSPIYDSKKIKEGIRVLLELVEEEIQETDRD